MTTEELLEKRSDEAEEELRKAPVPDYMVRPCLDYIVHGVPVGDFLQAVISNNFKEVAVRADRQNLNQLHGWAMALTWAFPAHSQGSPEKYGQWVELGGLRGVLAEADKPAEEEGESELGVSDDVHR